MREGAMVGGNGEERRGGVRWLGDCMGGGGALKTRRLIYIYTVYNCFGSQH